MKLYFTILQTITIVLLNIDTVNFVYASAPEATALTNHSISQAKLVIRRYLEAQKNKNIDAVIQTIDFKFAATEKLALLKSPTSQKDVNKLAIKLESEMRLSLTKLYKLPKAKKDCEIIGPTKEVENTLGFVTVSTTPRGTEFLPVRIIKSSSEWKIAPLNHHTNITSNPSGTPNGAP